MRKFGLVGTYRTQRLPNLTEIDLEAEKTTEAVPKGLTKHAHNRNKTVLAYEVMDNKAVNVVEMERVARHCNKKFFKSSGGTGQV